MTVTLMTRVNLGSGQYPLDGYVNVDAYCDAEIRRDLFELDFRGLEEVRMSHVLEHISWRKTDAVLKRVRGWLAPEGLLTVEVPDMDQILARGTAHPLWFKYVYGDQSHDGEYHRAGFTGVSLLEHLGRAGFTNIRVRPLISDHPGREGMPCLIAEARR